MPGLKRYETDEQMTYPTVKQTPAQVGEEKLSASQSIPIPQPVSSPTEDAFSCGTALSTDGQLENSSWRDTCDICGWWLEDGGVRDRKVLPCLSAFLYSTWIHRVPLLLAGPCGDIIGDALAAAVYRKTAARIDCSYPYSSRIIQKAIDNEEEKIVIFENPFTGQWIDRIPNLLLRREKHYILTCPFVEDLLLEPRSLFNYVMPVITELFIDTPPDEKLAASLQGWTPPEAYEDYQKVNESHPYYAKLLRQLNISRLVEDRIQKVLTDAHAMLKDERGQNVDMDFILALFPIAYLTHKGHILAETLKEGNIEISSDLRERLLRFLEEDDE